MFTIVCSGISFIIMKIVCSGISFIIMKLPPKTESSVQVKKTLGAGYPASTTAL